MTIHHLVIGGGGPFGFTAFGVLKHLHDVNFWNIKNIKTIYATSVGTLLAAFLLLGYDYSYIYDYFVKRPWEKIFNPMCKFFLSLLSNNINCHCLLQGSFLG